MGLNLTFTPMRMVTRLAGLATLVLGLAVMIGWHLKLPLVIQIHPSFVPMQYNTALGFLLAGAGLLSAQNEYWRVTFWTGGAVGLIGSLTLGQHVFALDLGLDQLFMRHYITVATPQPGRMAPNTALCFTLAGSALLMTGLARRGGHHWQTVCLLSSLLVGLSIVPMIGYVVGMPTAYGWGNLTRMAIHTAMGFMLLGGGLVAFAWQTDMSPQKWQPWAIGVLTMIITITLWQALQGDSVAAGLASKFMLAFGLLMALALAKAVAYSQKWRHAADDTKNALTQLNLEMAERQKAEEQVRHLAFYDDLTQLPNRWLLNQRLQQAISASKRKGHFGAVMFLDLDNFKPLNDAHGHAVGDLLLIEVAARLTSCVRETDTVARFGGDEFVVMLGELAPEYKASMAQANRVAAKIHAALSQPYRLPVQLDGHTKGVVEHYCSVSIGVTLFNSDQSTQDDILKCADMAMYQAKEAGRNQVRFYAPAA